MIKKINNLCELIKKSSGFTYKCKNSTFIKNKNGNLCYNHARLMYNQNIILIQKIFRGYKCRKYLKNIFYKLPNDLQYKILLYINKHHYQERYYKTLHKIILKKSNKLHSYCYYDDKLTFNYISECYKLYIKYHTIINISYLKHLYILSKQIVHYCHILQGYEDIFYTYPIFDKLDFNDINIDTINNLTNQINIYINIYYNTYNIFNVSFIN